MQKELALLVAVVVLVAEVGDILHRLWTMRPELDFRLYAEIVGFILIVGSLYILKREKGRAREREYNDLRRTVVDLRAWVRPDDGGAFAQWLVRHPDYQHAASSSLNSRVGVMMEWREKSLKGDLG